MKKVLMLVVALFASAGFAAAPTTAAAAKLSAYESVQASTDILLKRLVEVKPLYQEDPDAFFSAVHEALDPYIDFEGFSKRVMAKHYRSATEAQRQAFLLRFEDALIKTYATALLEFDNQKVVVIEPTTPQKDPDKAAILIEIYAKSGTIYPVHYQVSRQDGRWLLGNVIINGINIGLQFRSQFNASMQKYSKDIDRVIENWEVGVDDRE